MTMRLPSALLRAVSIGALALSFPIYSVYGSRYSVAYHLDCADKPFLRPVGDGTPDPQWLYAFLIAVVPILLCRRALLTRFVLPVISLYLALCLICLIDPYNVNEQRFGCPSIGGNNQDLLGAYLLFEFGFFVLIFVFYTMLAIDFTTRIVIRLLRSG